jgi:hypothetical protein
VKYDRLRKTNITSSFSYVESPPKRRNEWHECLTSVLFAVEGGEYVRGRRLKGDGRSRWIDQSALYACMEKEYWISLNFLKGGIVGIRMSNKGNEFYKSTTDTCMERSNEATLKN